MVIEFCRDCMGLLLLRQIVIFHAAEKLEWFIFYEIYSLASDGQLDQKKNIDFE